MAESGCCMIIIEEEAYKEGKLHHCFYIKRIK
jgi:hypothetical protein